MLLVLLLRLLVKVVELGSRQSENSVKYKSKTSMMIRAGPE